MIPLKRKFFLEWLHAVHLNVLHNYDNIIIEVFLLYFIFRCWLPSEKGMIFAFVGPMLAIMLVSNHYNKSFHKINDLCNMSLHTNHCIMTLLYNMEGQYSQYMYVHT